MNISNELLNALYIAYQGSRLKKIDFENWCECLIQCQDAIINDDENALEKQLIETISLMK